MRSTEISASPPGASDGNHDRDPQAFLESRRGSNLPRFLEAGRGRIRGAHFGPFDYTSSIGIASNAQDLLHPACDMARHMMQIAYAPAGVWLSDGPTNVCPSRERGAPSPSTTPGDSLPKCPARAPDGLLSGLGFASRPTVTRYAAVYSFYEESLGPLPPASRIS